MVSKSQKLLERMRRSKANWKRKDLDTLYLGLGFELIHGSSHDIVRHPEYRHLRATLPRHTYLAKVYVAQAIKLADELQSIQEKEHEQESNDQS